MLFRSVAPVPTALGDDFTLTATAVREGLSAGGASMLRLLVVDSRSQTVLRSFGFINRDS